MDDIWLEPMGRWPALSLEKKRRLYRVFMVLAGGASYLLDTLLLVLFFLAGTVEGIVVLVYGGLGLAHVLLFSMLHWSGYSERFTNSHLTVWQMMFAMGCQLVAMQLAPQIATFFLGLFFVIFGFGTLRINLRAALTMWAIVCLAVGTTMIFGEHQSLGIQSPSTAETFLIWFAFGTILLRSIGLGYYATILRMRMYARTHSLEQAVSKAKSLALHDALTGIFNRRAILPAIDAQLSLLRRKGIAGCLAMLDLDWFKRVNDRYGHPVGDRVLMDISRHVDGIIRNSDLFGRYGGEEFILLMPATALADASNELERIRQEIAVIQWPAPYSDLRVSLSCGLTELSPTDTADSVIQRADQALYAAKREGRDRICVLGGAGNVENLPD